MAKVTKKKAATKKVTSRNASPAKSVVRKIVKKMSVVRPVGESDAGVLDRLYTVVESRRNADPTISHSARLLSRGVAKCAQKLGEEAVECVIEAVMGNREALIGESADVLYHLLVVWVSAGVAPGEVWAELMRREGISGIAEKAARAGISSVALKPTARTTKIP